MSIMLVVCIVTEVVLASSGGVSSPGWKGEPCGRRLGTLPGCRCSCQVESVQAAGVSRHAQAGFCQQACMWGSLLGALPQLSLSVCAVGMHA